MKIIAFSDLHWLATAHPYVHFLQDQPITIDGVHFFGGTMWTDFLGGSEKAVIEARVYHT